MYERYTSVYERSGKKILRGRTAVERWSKVRTGTVFGVVTNGLPEGRLRGSKGLPTHERSYERCTSVTRAFTRDRAKKFSRQDSRRALVKGSNRYSLWRGNERASGRALAGVEGVANTRTLVREMYERYTSVYERSGKKNLRGRTGVERWSIIRTGTDFGGRYAGPSLMGGCGGRRGDQLMSAHARDV